MASIMDSISEYNPDNDNDDCSDSGDEQPNPNDQAFATNSQYVEMYLEHCVKERSLAKESYRAYRKWTYRFLNYLAKHKPGLTLLVATKNDILDYKYWIEANGNRRNSAASWMNAVRSLYLWMEENQHIENNPYPRSLVIKAKPPKNVLVPTPEQIFLIRRKLGMRMEQAACFEVLLSTGMRLAELQQLRPSDIFWNERPRDCEANGGVGAPSEHFISTVKLSRTRMILKTLEHKTYLSKIAVKLLKMYMAKFGLHEKSDMQLFPYGKNCILTWMNELGAGVINPEDNLHTTSIDQTPMNTGLIAVNDEPVDIDAGMSDKHKRQLRAAKQRLERDNARMPKEIVAREQRQVDQDNHANLHPHALRHFAICYNYYRNYFGERKNEIRLPRFFGHSRLATTAQTYLISLDVIKNDKEWVQVAKGHVFDWMAVK